MSQDSTWLASVARHRFSEVVDAAVAGKPQWVRRRDGREVVVVSREYFEANKPTLKSFLLSYTFEHDPGDGSFEAAVQEGRRLMSNALTPPNFAADKESEHGYAGYRRDQPPAASDDIQS